MKPGSAQRVGSAGAAVVGAGAAAGAATAAACCVGPIASPLIVAALGVGGSVAVAGLAPYTPYLLVGSFLALLGGFRLAYRRPRACAVGETRTSPPRWLRFTLWAASLVWLSSAVLSVLASTHFFE